MMPRTNRATANFSVGVAWGWWAAMIMAAIDGGATAARKLRRLMWT